MKKDYLFMFIVIILLFTFGLTGCTKDTAGAQPSVVRIEYAEGSVKIDGSDAEIGQTLKPAFIVSTGTSSYCDIIFDEKNILHFDEMTEAAIDLTNTSKIVDMRSGTVASILRNISGKVAKGTDNFQLTTPSIVAGVRGTVFLISVEDPDNTYVCTCNGELNLQGAIGGKGTGGEERSVKAAHHKAYRYTIEGDSVEYQEADLLYHNDRLMEMGAAAIGETIDWSKVDK